MRANTTVLILGGGYAGVMAANRLAAAGRPGLEVVLVDPGSRFTERIRLHEYAAGARRDPTVAFESLLHSDVGRVTGNAVRIDPAEQSVELGDGRKLPYDYLIYATGSSESAAPAGAYPVATLAGAAAARAALRALGPGSTVAVVGGGLSGLETAAETARSHRLVGVHLYTAGLPGPALPASSRSGLLRSLRRAGVEVHPNLPVSPDDPRHALGADVVLWCAGFSVPDLARRSGLPVDDAGRLLVNSTLRSVEEPRIFGAGDGAAVCGLAGAHLRMSCATALPMGADAGGNILRVLEGRPPRRHDSGFQAQCISMGRRDGLIQFLAADDTPRSLHIQGRTAAALKEIICRMTLRWIRSEAKRSGAYTWPKGPDRSPAVSTTPRS